ncbi:hypothetical protein HY003_04120 [Candidatus Saccharibacteria bacterium]|nr:hypothetical protein [Candidatus Saccharibacteria bacterium]MBI3338455.1 hypothetical protein [Candidatus Saccharibacteria bacterium]
MSKRGPCREAVLEAGVLELGFFEFASGKKGNNKLEIDHLFTPENSLRLKIIMHHLARITMRFEPDVLIGIPRGGEKLAEELVKQPELRGTSTAYLQKIDSDLGSKSYDYKTEEDGYLIVGSSNIVIVEDVFNNFTSSRGVLEVPEVLERTRALVAIWDRGNHPSRPGVPVPYEALVTEFIPSNLNEYDELYGYGVKQKQ